MKKMLSGTIALIGAVALLLCADPVRGRAAQPQSGAAMTVTGDQPATMDPAVKTNAFHELLHKLGAGQNIDPKLMDTFVAAQNDGIHTGPSVGSKVPDFTLPDQHGAAHSLHQLMGPKGLLLVFLRSADW